MTILDVSTTIPEGNITLQMDEKDLPLLAAAK
jgi:hypothetical protein